LKTTGKTMFQNFETRNLDTGGTTNRFRHIGAGFGL